MLQKLTLRNVGPVAGGSDIADDPEAALVAASAQPLGDRCGALPGAPHQHPALENLLVDDLQKYVPGQGQSEKRKTPGQTDNADERNALLRKADGILYEEAPVWFFNYNKAVLAYQPWIHGLQANPTEITHQYTEDVWVDDRSPAK